jgi:hypothetical protein
MRVAWPVMSEVILADDVVPVEHAARQMAGHRHRDALGDARTDHVPGRSATQAVLELSLARPPEKSGGAQDFERRRLNNDLLT